MDIHKIFQKHSCEEQGRLFSILVSQSNHKPILDGPIFN